MTRSQTGLVVIYACGMVACFARGGTFVDLGFWAAAALMYAMGVVCLAGVLFELSLDPQDDCPADPVPPGGIRTRYRTYRAVRAARRRMCPCDRYWTSIGTEHDDWCPRARRTR
ncbi:hypothetical protein GCM10010250_21510 [Streptomyces althioticus]|uniref:hypothetical protein n=1 Tax=Streptomyces althioticus TaxID=83380 RepID=UPI0018767DAB|nr:hypothetical protein GCM10010250_21510 [Streptomyces althioticus]